MKHIREFVLLSMAFSVLGVCLFLEWVGLIRPPTEDQKRAFRRDFY